MGFTRSAIDDKTFFISPIGGKNPKAELDATINAFLADPIENIQDQHPACRYPARYHWLNEKLNLSGQMKPFTCDRFEEWLKKLNPEAVSLVFSSYYMNNPASMYGHTFLKLSRQGFDAGEGILDYTINYEAVTNTNNGIMFAFKGLAGGYRGRFSTLPYYMKIQKYNNMESRDLWEYELNLDQAAVDQLVRHLWELGPNSMAYYFFNKNCSYQLLPLIEVADPKYRLANQFRWRAIPLDTIRAVLNERGLVSEYKFRPSHVYQMLGRRDRLTVDEIKLAEDVVKKKEINLDEMLRPYSPIKQALLLESAHDFHRFEHGFYRIQPESVKQREQDILSALNKSKESRHPGEGRDLDSKPDSKNQVTAWIPDQVRDDGAKTSAPGGLAMTPNPPHAGHNSLKIHFGFGDNDGTEFEEIGVRFAIHDLESDPTGFVEGSQLEMLSFRGRFENERDKFNLEQITFIDIFSLTAWDRWVHPPAWHVRTSIEVARDLNIDAEDSLHANLSGGSGYAFHIPTYDKGLVYFMWLGDAGVGSVFDDDYRLGLGGLTGALFSTGSRWRHHVSAAALRFPTGHVGNKVKLKYVSNLRLFQNLELRATLERQNAYKEALIALNYYH